MKHGGLRHFSLRRNSFGLSKLCPSSEQQIKNLHPTQASLHNHPNIYRFSDDLATPICDVSVKTFVMQVQMYFRKKNRDMLTDRDFPYQINNISRSLSIKKLYRYINLRCDWRPQGIVHWHSMIRIIQIQTRFLYTHTDIEFVYM